MSRIVLVLFALVLCSTAWPQNDNGPALREIVEASRTNLAAALVLCDRAIAGHPTNAQPLLLRARLLERERRYEDGIRDLTAALKLAPKAAEIYQKRGELNFKASHFQASVADFDRVIELAPAEAAHHWQRGISLYYAGRFSEGRKQFELHQTVNPNDVENATWHFVCVARDSGVTNARATMLKVGDDARIPMREIDALYRGAGSVERVFEAATRAAKGPRGREALFYAHLYLGLYFEVLGDASKAREHIGKAAGEFSGEHYMGDVARVHLRYMRAAP
jgi:lipoprotein NlpI